MAEYDKTRKKKFFPSPKDKDPVLRRPVILVKNDREGVKDVDRERIQRDKPVVEKEKQPVILIKPREPSASKEPDTRSQSPKKISGKENEIETQIIHPTKIVQNENKEKKTAEVKSVAPPITMTHPVKIVDESFEFLPTGAEYLQSSNTNFLVVGVIGAQSVGKSTILNILAHDHDLRNIGDKILRSHEQELSNTKAGDSETSNPEKSVLQSLENNINVLNIDSADNPTDKKASKPLIFKCQSIDQIERGQACTTGIDMYVTESRVILLDAGAAGGGGVSRLGAGAGAAGRSTGGGAGLEAATLLLTVCHVVILVQDWFADVNMLRFIQSAEMVKPNIPASSNKGQTANIQGASANASQPGQDSGDTQTPGEHHPHLLFLQNKCLVEDFRPEAVKMMQQLYRQAFSRCKVHTESGMFMYDPESDDSSRPLDGLFHNLNSERCGKPVNLFLMPMVTEDHEKNDVYRGHPTIEELAGRLRWLVFGASRNQLTNVALTELSWYYYCSKSWDHIKKSTFFIEYGRLLP